jgi:hypothetical protein
MPPGVTCPRGGSTAGLAKGTYEKSIDSAVLKASRNKEGKLEKI